MIHDRHDVKISVSSYVDGCILADNISWKINKIQGFLGVSSSIELIICKLRSECRVI